MKSKEGQTLKTKVILIMVLLCGFGGTARAQWDGEGTSDSPYLIKTGDHLVTLATNSKTNQYSGKYFRLENDLNMNGVEIGTIGVNGNPFNGTFDGNGHAIRNITISLPEAVNSGLFGFISTNSTVKNIILDGASISGKNYVGALVGYANRGATIKNCLIVNASVTGGPYAEAGIIVGFSSSDFISGNYYYDCSITHSGKTKTTGIGTFLGDMPGAILATAAAVLLPDAWVAFDANQFVVGGLYYNGTVYYDASAGYTFGPATWAALQTALDNASTDANNPTVLTLAADITASNTDTYLTLTGGRHVILDLNGHTIDRHMTAAKEGDGHVIQVYGSTTSLTIRDSSPGQNGTITGGWNRYGAGCINVTGSTNGGATLRLEGGTISGNRVAQNGGAISLSGNFYMTGGSITGNAANLDNLNSVYCAGALYFGNSSHFYMSGGSITGNYCGTTDTGAAGIGCYTGMGSSHVHLSGTYNISGNQQGDYDSSNGTWSNLSPSDILNHERITYDIDAAISPSQPARMIIAARDSKATFTSGWATYMSGKDPELAFTLANPNGQGIGLNASGEATIGTLHTITLADGITASAAKAAPGRPITLSGARAPITSDNLTFGTYYVVSYNDGTEDHTDRYAADEQGKATFLMPGADVTVTMESYCSSVAYIDADGSTKYRTDCILIDGSQTEFSDGVWFVVIDNVKIDEEVLAFSNNANLILCDGATLTVSNVSYLEGISAYNLAIYGQSEGTGRLDVSVDAPGSTAIEADYDFTLYGGTVNATNTCINSGCGIKANNVIVNGGSLTATSTGGAWCFGINISGSNGEFVINGGNVVVNGSEQGVFAQEGDITLGWTKGSDSIYANSYYTGSISVKAGQTLSNGEETLISGITNYSKVNGKTLRPVPATGDATKSITAHQSAYAGQTRYWATFYHPVWNYVVPVGAQAFTMGSDHALYRIGDGTIIPAGCAVVIMAEASALTSVQDGSGTLTLTATNETASAVIGNILKGTISKTDKSNVHVMSKVGNTFGFFPFIGSIPANKAYYE